MSNLYGKQQLEAHPLANLFPLIEGAAFDELRQSVAENGLIRPITIFEGKILDGRNRYRALRAAGLPLHADDVREFHGDEVTAKALVEAENLHRRHLSASERALIVARLTNWQFATRRADSAGTGSAMSVDEAAAMGAVSPFLVKQARKVLASAEPHIVQMVERGEIVLDVANAIARLPAEDQKTFTTAAACQAHVRGEAKLARKQQPSGGFSRRQINRIIGDLFQLSRAHSAGDVVTRLNSEDRRALAQIAPHLEVFMGDVAREIAAHIPLESIGARKNSIA